MPGIMQVKHASECIVHGISISPGLAMGKAFVYTDILLRDHELYAIEQKDLKEEYDRIELAVREVKNDLHASAERVEKELNSEIAGIFKSQAEILKDPTLRTEIKTELESNLVNAEQIIKRVFRRWEMRLRQVQDEIISHRADDIVDLSRRLIRALTGIHAHTLERLPHNSIIIAKRLLPSDTVFLSRKSARAIITEYGGPASHTALLTKEIGIPSVGKIPDIFNLIRNRDTLLVDGTEGAVIVNPRDETVRQFESRVQQHTLYIMESRNNCHEPAKRKDGTVVEVMANVSCRKDVEQALKNGADGIGLFRIENLYLSRKLPPSSQELADEIARVIAPARGKPITIRLLDLGGDKRLTYLTCNGDDSFLGRRGIRFLLEFPELLYTQFKALLHLVDEYNIKLLVPMVTLPHEIKMVREICTDLCSLASIKKKITLGIMIETPAAALCVEDFLQYADFLSIGTNDLTQYTMAVDRENTSVSQYFIDDHPAIFKLIQAIIIGSGGMPISLCGELAGRISSLNKVLQTGIKSLSVAPSLIPEVKNAIRNFS